MKATISSVLIVLGCARDSARCTLVFNHLALSVEDVDRSADFYRRTLNLSELSRASRSKGVRWFSLGRGTELHLVSREYYEGEAVTTNKAVHFALSTDRFDDALKQLGATGVVYGDWAGIPGKVDLRSDGVSQVFFQDPDGYWIELNNAGKQ